jgi:4-hydroxybenzoate polyprenyltransferase
MYWLSLAYKMLRFRTVLMMLLFLAIGDAATKNSTTYDYRLLLMFPLLGFLFIIATSINDIADEEIDKINLAKDESRPLATNTAQKKQLIELIIFSFIAAIITASAINREAVMIVIISVFLSYIYSMPPIQISHRGILAPILLPTNYVLLPYLLGASIHPGSWSKDAIVLVIGLYISFIGRIILKDFRDVEGDAKFGKRTFLVRYGPTKTCQAASVTWIIGDLFIVSLYIRTNPILIILLQFFIAAIFYALYALAREKKVARQLILVNLVGRLGNSVALIILTELSLKYMKFTEAKNNLALSAVALVGIYTSYYLYDLYKKSMPAKRTK